MDHSRLPIIPIEEQFKIIADTAPVMIWISGEDKQCYFFNAGWLRFTGRTMEQEYGNGWAEGVHPDDFERCLKIYTSSFDEHKEFRMEYRLKRYDGVYRWILDHGVPRYHTDGTFAGYIGSCMDIDELLESERVKSDFVSMEAVKKVQGLNEELAATNEELSAANEELAATNDELQRAHEDLENLNNELEEKVTQRTAELAKSEASLQILNDELLTTNEELAATNEELAATNEELAATNEELQQSQMDLQKTVVELVTSEQKIRSLVESAPFPIGVYVGKEMRIEMANQAIIDVWGKGDDVIGKLYSTVLPELENQEIFNQLDQVYTTGIPFHARNRKLDIVVNEKLQPYYFNYSFTPLYDAAGQVYGVMSTSAEITDLVLAKQEVERSERLFRSMALNIPDSLIIVLDKDCRYVAVEGDLMAKHKFDRNHYEGRSIAEVMLPDPFEVSIDFHKRVMAGEHFSVERKSEQNENFTIHFVPLKNENGEVYAALIIALDVTEIRKGEERSARLAAIIESSNDAVISKGLDSVITSWNSSAERMFGYTPEEMIGQSILKIIPPERHDEELHIISRIKSGERIEHFETQRVTKDNKLIDLSLTVSPVKNKQGAIIGVSKIARDISDKKLEESRKNDFIAMVSHELKTPLTSMRAYIQLLLSKSRTENDDFRTNVLTRAEVQAKKMTSMINDFLSLARLEEGKISLNFEQFQLQSLIEEVVSDAQFLSTNHTIRVSGCNNVQLKADRDKIGQVLNNLLSNAIKYSPNGGNIEINCMEGPDTVTISVKDEGVGIKAEDQKQLFDRFYRVQNDKVKTVSGFGIGLYLVSEILRYHHSRIQVESYEGKGSTFYFTIKKV